MRVIADSIEGRPVAAATAGESPARLRRVTHALAWLVLLGSTMGFGQQVQTIDRIVATVNHQPVLQSEWEDGLRFEAFLQGRLPDTFTPEEKEKALNRLIDRVLLGQQMQADYSSSPQELAEREEEIRTQLQGAESDKGWHDLLTRYGMTEAGFDAALGNQLTVMRFVELRLRPTVRITREDVEEYYNQTLAPTARKTGKEPEPLEQLRPRIRELLVQRQMDTVLEDWLANLRSQSEVHVTTETGDSEKPATDTTVKDPK
jgi:hypothetical protein